MCIVFIYMYILGCISSYNSIGLIFLWGVYKILHEKHILTLICKFIILSSFRSTIHSFQRHHETKIKQAVKATCMYVGTCRYS